MLAHEFLELTDKLPVLTEQEVGFDPALERSQPKRLQAGDRGLSEPLLGEVR